MYIYIYIHSDVVSSILQYTASYHHTISERHPRRPRTASPGRNVVLGCFPESRRVDPF